MATRAGTRTLALAAALAVVVVGCSRQPQATPTPAPTPQPVAAPAAGPMRGADAAAADRVLRQRAEKCPVTIANGSGPPSEYPSPDHHGNGALWTALPPGGIDKGGTPEPDGSTSQKYPWWTVGTTGELTIRGRRVDAPAPPLRARSGARSGGGVPETPFAAVPGGRFWPSGIYFPTEGCWQVTGRVGRTSLTFVVLMARP
jgi:hypothetical protein